MTINYKNKITDNNALFDYGEILFVNNQTITDKVIFNNISTDSISFLIHLFNELNLFC